VYLPIWYTHLIQKIITKRVIIAQGVIDDPRCRRRLEAMLPFIKADSVETLDDAAVQRELVELGARETRPRGGLQGAAKAKDVVAFARLADEDVFPGYSWRERRSGRQQLSSHSVLCQTAIEIQNVVGCAFDCTYCPYSSFICIRLDVEHFVDNVANLATDGCSQSLFKLNNRSDTLALEPELGLAAALVQRFAELDDKYLMLYSKGHEVQHLLDLDHQKKTVACFTLTPDSVATLLETSAPSPNERIEAISALHRAGYPTRVRFSPIVPLKGWEEAYADLISRLFAVAKPEMVTLWTLSMIEVGQLSSIVPLGQLDPEILRRSEAAAGEMKGKKGAPFPDDLRVEMYRKLAQLIYQASPSTLVALCLEAPNVWDGVAPLIRARQGRKFLCNCGPQATPPALALHRRTSD
jgi:DNA repair photolyase